MTTKKEFLNKWVRNNIIAYVLGLGILQPLIAHGFAGEHDVELTFLQFIMHTVSLVNFSILLTYLQNKALQAQFTIKTWNNLIYFLIGIPLLFWAGYYTLYIPFDILFMLLTIGLINGLGLKKYMKDGKKWGWQILLSMFIGAIAGIAVGIGSYFTFIKDMKGIAGDFAIWLLISGPAAITSSLISKYYLNKQIE